MSFLCSQQPSSHHPHGSVSIYEKHTFMRWKRKMRSLFTQQCFITRKSVPLESLAELTDHTPAPGGLFFCSELVVEENTCLNFPPLLLCSFHSTILRSKSGVCCKHSVRNSIAVPLLSRRWTLGTSLRVKYQEGEVSYAFTPRSEGIQWWQPRTARPLQHISRGQKRFLRLPWIPVALDPPSAQRRNLLAVYFWRDGCARAGGDGAAVRCAQPADRSSHGGRRPLPPPPGGRKGGKSRRVLR